MAYKKISFSTIKQADNYANYIDAITNNTFYMCNKKKATSDEFYLLINPEKTSKDMTMLTDNYYETIISLLSSHFYQFLDYQNLDNYCKLFAKSSQFLEEFSSVTKFLKVLPWTERERMMIYSGAGTHFMGTIYTQDVDLVYIAKDEKSMDIYKELIKKCDVDIHVILPDRVIELKEEMKNIPTLEYKNDFYKYEMAEFVGVKDIYELW